MKKQLAAMLAIAMIASLSVPSFAEVGGFGSQTGKGDNDVKNPIVSYQIPIDLEFAVDPFQKADSTTGSQVFSGDFAIINMSDVAIKASVSAEVIDKTADSSVVLKTSPKDVNQSDMNNRDKEVYLEAVAAKTVTTAEKTPAKTYLTTRPEITVGDTADTSVTIVDGDGVGTEGTITVDLANITTTGAAGAIYNLLIKDNAGVVKYEVTGVATTAATGMGDVATSFNGTTFKATASDSTEVTYTAGTATGTSIEFTASADKNCFGGAGNEPSDWVYELVPAEGEAAVVELSSVPGTYPAFDAEKGSATAAKLVFEPAPATPDPDAVPKSLDFILEKGTYDKSYTDDKEDKVFKTMAATDKGVAAFRLMGAANPNAKWKAGDFTVKVVYDISGVSSKTYSAIEWPQDESGKPIGQNVASAGASSGAESATPSLNGSAADSTAAISDLLNGSVITIPYTLGTNGTATKVAKVEHKLVGKTAFTAATATLFDTTTTAGAVTLKGALVTNLKNLGGDIKVTFDDGTALTITLTK